MTANSQRRGFTLIELIISTTIFAVMMTALFGLFAETQKVWSSTRAQLGQFQEAQKAFQLMTRRISEATLNPYWDYEYPGGDKTKTPVRYVRTSELHFVAGDASDLTGQGAGATLVNGLRPTHAIFFQGPFGFHNHGKPSATTERWQDFNVLLNSWGYFIELNEDTDRPPHAPIGGSIAPRQRFRLMELRAPAEVTSIYDVPSIRSDPNAWFRDKIDGPSVGGKRMARPIAENIVALIISPQTTDDPNDSGDEPTAIAPSYTYNTRGYLTATNDTTAKARHQLPPLVRLTMIAVDEPSALRIDSLIAAGNMPAGLSTFLTSSNTFFSQAANYEDDLERLEQALIDSNIGYRVFTSTVRLRNARWSATD